MVDIISLEDKQTWNDRIRSMLFYDFYHLNEYHKLDTTGVPLLFYYEDSQVSIAFPFILRKISGTEYNDISSVYGYPGPVASTIDFLPANIQNFQNELSAFFDDNNVVSAFSRLHPLMPEQSSLLKDMGLIKDLNLTVGVDLTLSQEIQKKNYARSLRTQINHLNRIGVKTHKAETSKEIDIFIDIYRENMTRLKASKEYFFSDEYFYSMMKNIDSFILLAHYKGEYIAGSLFTECNGILQAHLNATRTDTLCLSPLKLVLDEGRKLGVNDHMRCMHLGGGLNGKNDSLFTFKSRFSKTYFVFCIWKYIHNEPVYHELSSSKRENKREGLSFFPLYRA